MLEECPCGTRYPPDLPACPHCWRPTGQGGAPEPAAEPVAEVPAADDVAVAAQPAPELTTLPPPL